MNYLPQETPSGTKLNLDALYQLFPQCFTETRDEATGELRRVINFTLLRQMLGDEAVEDMPEAYEFTWVGKQDAKREAAKPIRKTLRPCKEESVDWDTTQNLYIEGDNLEVLKLLQKSYVGKVKMIYIDPPYNTGNDFIYNDNFSMSQADYDEAAGNIDEEGNRFRKNEKTNGKFHSDWCSMMYSRLLVARSLLMEDGVVLISIGDDEQSNLRQICNEVFGESNFIATCARIAKRTSNKGTYFKPTKDNLLVYGKNIASIDWKFGVYQEPNIKDFPFKDEKGYYKKNGASLYQPSLDSRANQRYYIECPDGSFIIPPGNIFPDKVEDAAYIKPLSNADKCWRWSWQTYLANKDKLIFTPASATCPLIDSNGRPSKWNIYDKVYFENKDGDTLLPEDVIYDYVNSQGTKELIELGIPFSYAKPSNLIKYLISICRYPQNITILDFFSGSATTAQAVMQLNAEDGGKRRFIMVQLPEETAEDSDAYQAGYKTIPEIAKDRIRCAAKKIKTENPLTTQDLDTGFRVFKCAEGNMKDVYYQPKDYNQNMLLGLLDNVKEDRTDLDLLCGCMLDWGVELSLPFCTEQVDACHIHIVNEGDLVACFDRHVTDHVIERIATLNPLRVVFRDSCFEGAAEKMNLFELFKQKCGWSEEEVLNNIRVI